MNGIYFMLAILCCAVFSLSYTLAVFRDSKYTFYYIVIPFGLLMVIFTFLGGLS